jgi:uncharacterized membrane protein
MLPQVASVAPLTLLLAQVVGTSTTAVVLDQASTQLLELQPLLLKILLNGQLVIKTINHLQQQRLLPSQMQLLQISHTLSWTPL